MNSIFKTLIPSLLLLWAIPLFTQGQNLDWLRVAESFAEHDGNSYILQDSTKYERNIDGDIVKITSYEYDELAGVWEPNELREFTLNAEGKTLRTEISNYVPATQSFTVYSRTDYTYDGNGNTLVNALSFWQGATSTWRLTNRSTTTYTANNLIATNEVESYNLGTNVFEFTFRTENTYDANQNIINKLQQTWDGSNWVNQRETIYTNNANGDATVLQENIWVPNTGWRNFERTTNTYNTDGRRTIQLREIWDTGINDWKNSFRYNDTYDSIGRNIEATKHNWDEIAQDWQIEYINTTTFSSTSQILVIQRWNTTAQALLNSSRIEYGKEVNNQRVDIYESWSTATNDWTGNRTQTTIYDPAYDGKQVSYEVKEWDGTQYAEDRLSKYYYEQFEVSSIDGIEYLADVAVFPNPFTERVNFRISPAKATQVSIQVFNLQGQLVSTVINGENIDSPSNFTWAGEGHGAGMYLYQLTIDGVSTSGQLLLSK